MKKAIVTIVTLIIIILMVTMFLFNYNNYQSIQQYVNNNQDELNDIAIKMIENEKAHIPSKVKAVQTFSSKDVIVQFDMISFTKQYCGFYYSPQNIPVAFQNSNVALNKINDKTWEWQLTGDNKGKTIKILDNWYYFEASL